MIISELPPFIQKIAELRRTTDNNNLDSCFVWANTIEGHTIWLQVSNGNYQPFYEFHVKLYEDMLKIYPSLIPKKEEIKQEVKTFPRLMYVLYDENIIYLKCIVLSIDDDSRHPAKAVMATEDIEEYLNNPELYQITYWRYYKEIDE